MEEGEEEEGEESVGEVVHLHQPIFVPEGKTSIFVFLILAHAVDLKAVENQRGFSWITRSINVIKKISYAHLMPSRALLKMRQIDPRIQ